MKSIRLTFLSFILFNLYFSCSPDSEQKELTMKKIIPEGKVIFEDNFQNLNNWHPEGFVEGVTLFEQGTMRLDCSGSEQGGIGCMAFCKQDFTDSIAIEFDFYMEEKNGLVLVFCGMKGLNGEDAITELPLRKGMFDEYTGEDALIRSYHVSISRYDDNGVHTGVSNWRRNPGLHLMAQGEDYCKEIRKKYHIVIIKAGPTCQLQVDGKVASGFTDPQTLPDEIPTSGEIGFRAIGKKAIARISDFKIMALK
jgi:hypothetical protein